MNHIKLKKGKTGKKILVTIGGLFIFLPSLVASIGVPNVLLKIFFISISLIVFSVIYISWAASVIARIEEDNLWIEEGFGLFNSKTQIPLNNIIRVGTKSYKKGDNEKMASDGTEYTLLIYKRNKKYPEEFAEYLAYKNVKRLTAFINGHMLQ